jgi:hypothetical protein
LSFYDWESLELVRRIEIQPRSVYWSENGELVCISTDDSYFILSYDSDAVVKARENKENISDDGIETAFNVSNLTFGHFVLRRKHGLLIFKGLGRASGISEDRTLGWRLFYLHQWSEPFELLCWRGNCYNLAS